MLSFLVRRLFAAALMVFGTAVFAYGGLRALRPEIAAGCLRLTLALIRASSTRTSSARPPRRGSATRR